MGPEQSYEISGFFRGTGYRIKEVENAGDEHWPLCHVFWYTWADGKLLAISGDQYWVGCQYLDGNHRTYLEDYPFSRHLQSIVNIFSSQCIALSLCPVSFSKRNSKRGQVMEIFIHSLHNLF